MKLSVLANLLTAAGEGALGEAIFIHNMPAIPEAVLFRLPLEGIKRDVELPGRFKSGMQVIVRGNGTEAVETRAKRIAALLTMGETTFPGMFVIYIRERTLPILYPRSEQAGSVEASLNFDCCYILT